MPWQKGTGNGSNPSCEPPPLHPPLYLGHQDETERRVGRRRLLLASRKASSPLLKPPPCTKQRDGDGTARALLLDRALSSSPSAWLLLLPLPSSSSSQGFQKTPESHSLSLSPSSPLPWYCSLFLCVNFRMVFYTSTVYIVL